MEKGGWPRPDHLVDGALEANDVPAEAAVVLPVGGREGDPTATAEVRLCVGDIGPKAFRGRPTRSGGINPTVCRAVGCCHLGEYNGGGANSMKA